MPTTLATKTIWHPMALQQMQSDQFIRVVNGVLDGRYEMIPQRLRQESSSRRGRQQLSSRRRA